MDREKILKLGENCQYKKILVGQVLIADLVAERYFWEIAQKKVDLNGVLINPAGRLDKIQSEANKLSSKYGKKIHEAWVDQSVLAAHRPLDKFLGDSHV